MTITKKISIMAAACTTIASIAVGTLSILNANSALDSDADRIMETAQSSISSDINSYLSKIEQSVDTLAETAMSDLDDFEAFKTDSAYVDAYTDKLEQLLLSSAGNTDGAICAYIRYNPDFTEPTSGLFMTRNSTDEAFQSVTPTDFSTYDKTDIAHVGWYYTPVNNGGPTWMNPYLNENVGIYMISYVVPLFRDGVNAGIVGMDIDFTTVQDLAEASDTYKTGMPIITDSDGNVIYGRDMTFGTSLAEYCSSDSLTSAVASGQYDEPIVCSINGTKRKAVFSTIDNGMDLIFTAESSELSEQTGKMVMYMLSAVIFVAAVTAAVAITVSIKMTRSLRDINRAAQKVAAGELDVTVKAASKDDIGVLADSLGQTTDQLRNYSGYISELSDVLNRIAAGDLDISLTMEYKGEFGKLKAALENITASLNETLVSIDTAADQVATGADQVSVGAQALASGSTEQASSIEQLVSTIDDMSEQIKVNAERAEKVSESMDHIGGEANLSNERMNRMLEAMKDINDNTDRISAIIKTIEDIAFQTNILALNAAVEAARAGEAGKGFAVVADEVRNLASRSAEASRNTSALISRTTEAVENGSQIANQTAESLNTVVTSISEIVESIDSIAQNTHKQSEAINHVSTYVEQLSEVTQNNSAASEQSAAAAEELAGQANTMKRLTGKFTLKK